MSDFLQIMAAASAERAALSGRKRRILRFVPPCSTNHCCLYDWVTLMSLRKSKIVRLPRVGLRRRKATVLSGRSNMPSRFSGSLEHLEEVAAAVPGTPVMRKDFLVAPIQILEARQAGASGVLLIATMLDDDKLRRMLDCAWENGMFVLLESFDSNDLARSNRLLDNEVDRKKADDSQLLLGVNTRNLRTLEVDSDRLEKLALELPLASCVAESGLHTAEDAARVAGLGYTLALVGTALMRSDDPADLVRQMRAAGRECFSA